MTILSFLLALSVSAREPSIGINYNETGFSSSANTGDLFSAIKTQSLIVDLICPLNKWLDFTLAGGPSILSVDSWKQTYQLKTVTVYPGGGIIGTYGESGAYPRSRVLHGYNLSAGLRWYLK